MYNESALALSNKNLPAQIEFLKTCRPDIKQVVTIDSKINPKADYFYEVDALGICIDGQSKTIQFKARKEGNKDLMLIGKKLTGKAANNLPIGFIFNDCKYTFNVKTDLICERLDCKDVLITREELNIIEVYLGQSENVSLYIKSIQPKYIYADDGSKFHSGDYYIFIELGTLSSMLDKIFKLTNPHLFS